MDTNKSPYMNEKELAEYLSVNQQTIARLRKNGFISGIKLNRSWIYRKSEADQLFDRYANCNLTAKSQKKIERRTHELLYERHETAH